jgi:hypothetical protein
LFPARSLTNPAPHSKPPEAKTGFADLAQYILRVWHVDPRSCPVCQNPMRVDIQFLCRQDRGMLGEAQNQFSLTRAAWSTCRRPKSKFLSVSVRTP